MASLVDLVRIKAPAFDRSGTDAGRYTAEWFVDVDDYVPAARAIQLGQSSPSIDRIPVRGQTFRWVSATEVFRDLSVQALEFNADHWENAEDFPRAWRVSVTWRSPEPGSDEQPGTVGLPPLARPPEYWIEWDVQDYEYSEGFVVDPITIQLAPGPAEFVALQPGNFGPLRNAAGEQFTVPASRLLPVIVKQQNVASDFVALRLNNDFESTTNSTNWSCRGLTITPHHARFLRAETGQRVFEDQWQYYRMQIRIAIGRFPFYDVRPHRGTIHYEAPQFVAEAHYTQDGTILFDGPINKNRGGAANFQGTLRWLLYNPKDYNDEPLLAFR